MINQAVIFDMDGVIIDSNPFHVKSWRAFAEKYDFEITEQDLEQHVFGRMMKDALQYFFKGDMSDEEIERYGEEKEIIFREMFKPYIKPVDGLMHFLDDMKAYHVKMAVATSASLKNLDFMFENIPIRHYFEALLDASCVEKGKPDPDIYLKAASMLDVPPEQCVVIEDSLSGVKSGLNAGMKVIGVTTTHTSEELNATDITVADFTELDYQNIAELLK